MEAEELEGLPKRNISLIETGLPAINAKISSTDCFVSTIELVSSRPNKIRFNSRPEDCQDNKAELSLCWRAHTDAGGPTTELDKASGGLTEDTTEAKLLATGCFRVEPREVNFLLKSMVEVGVFKSNELDLTCSATGSRESGGNCKRSTASQ